MWNYPIHMTVAWHGYFQKAQTCILCIVASAFLFSQPKFILEFDTNSSNTPILKFRIPPPRKLKFRQILTLWVFSVSEYPPPKKLKFRQILTLWVFSVSEYPPPPNWDLVYRSFAGYPADLDVSVVWKPNRLQNLTQILHLCSSFAGYPAGCGFVVWKKPTSNISSLWSYLTAAALLFLFREQYLSRLLCQNNLLQHCCVNNRCRRKVSFRSNFDNFGRCWNL